MAGKPLLTERERQEKPTARGLATCAAAGCPLMGTIRRETSHDAVCPCHARASTDGWPKATAVIARHHSLWWLAREAQCSPTPDALSVDLAADLLRAAKCAGVKLSNGQREQYRAFLARLKDGEPGMPLRMAGTLVEDAICAEAVDAASASEVAVPIGERRVSKLETAIRGIAMNLSEAA